MMPNAIRWRIWPILTRSLKGRQKCHKRGARYAVAVTFLTRHLEVIPVLVG